MQHNIQDWSVPASEEGEKDTIARDAKEGSKDLPLFAFCEVAFSCQGVFLALEETDDFVKRRFEFDDGFLKSVWVFDCREDGAFGSVCFDRVRIGCAVESAEARRQVR